MVAKQSCFVQHKVKKSFSFCLFCLEQQRDKSQEIISGMHGNAGGERLGLPAKIPG